MGKERSKFFLSRSGFMMAEIIVSLVFIALAIVLVGALVKQVTNLSKSGKQAGVAMEMRNRTNALLHNSPNWLAVMRGDSTIGTIYSGCLPDSGASGLGYTCPAVDDTLLTNDKGLASLATCVDPNNPATPCTLHPYSTPIVDTMGVKIAGTTDAPLYMDSDGRPCTATNPATNCPMISTGYFLRKDPHTDVNPGYVRFVVKVSQNQAAVSQRMGVNVMKPQYMSMDVGTDWNVSNGSCPSGSIKLGYLSSGAPYCVNTTQSCGSGLVAVGVKPDGSPNCQSVPSCSAGQSAVLDATTNSVKCAGGTPCGDGQLFLGYIAGSGSPMCSSPDVSCPAGQVQTGLSTVAGNLTAQCQNLPSCSESQKLTYDGSKFMCVATIAAVSCNSTQYVSGVDDAGRIICTDRTIASTTDCPDGQYVYGVDTSGNVKCKILPTFASSSSNSAASGGGGNSTVQAFEGIVPQNLYKNFLFTGTGHFSVPNPFPGRVDLVVDWSMCLRPGMAEAGYSDNACLSFVGVNGEDQYYYISHDTQNLYLSIGTPNPGFYKKATMTAFMPNWDKWDIKYRVITMGGGSGAASSTFVSAQVPFASQVTFTHGLGHVPSFVRLVIVNISSDLGYPVGTEVSVSGETSYLNQAVSDVTIAVNDSSIVATVASANSVWGLYLLPYPGGGTAAKIDTSKWKFKVYAQ